MFLIALRHLDSPEEAIIVNTNIGGDTVNRGAIVGAIMGAIHMKKGFPARWFDQLADRAAMEETVQQFVASVAKKQ